MRHFISSPIVMNFLRLLCLPMLLAVGLTASRWWSPRATTSTPQAAPSAAVAYGQLPLRFEANRGQSPSSAGFLARGGGYRVALSAQAVTLTLTEVLTSERAEKAATPLTKQTLAMLSGQWLRRRQPLMLPRVGATVRMALVNANADALAVTQNELPGKVSYLLGAESQWRADIPTYAHVRYAAVYPGVDVLYYGQQRQLEYDFIVAPHADPRVIRLQFTGAERLEIDATGDLVLHCGARQIRQHKPVVYQTLNGARQTIESGYALNEAGQATFVFGAYDTARALVIDPVLSYSTYWGSTARGLTQDNEGFDFGDFGAAIAADAAGNAYVTGYTFGNDFPTEKPVQASNGGGVCGASACPDMFVLKLNPAGSVLYSTYLGGNGLDFATSIAVDGQGNAYVTGVSTSSNFPVGRPANRGQDAVIVKLSADGSRILSNYALGGTGEDIGTGIALDAAGNAYVTGTTYHPSKANDFPIAGQPLQRTPGGALCAMGGETLPCTDAFIAKLNANGSTLDYASYLGGASFDVGGAIAVDAQGRIHVSGSTTAENFPTTENALKRRQVCDDPDFCFDGFVTKLSADGASLLYSTYLGGTFPDFAQGLALDSQGNFLVSGSTLSDDFPLKNPISASNTVATAFAMKFDANGALVYSTFVGGREIENLLHFAFGQAALFGFPFNPNLIAADAAGNAYVTGATHSSDFPTLNAVQRQLAGGNCAIEGNPIPCPDAFVTKLSPTGALVYSTYLGGRSEDGTGLQGIVESGFGIAADAAGNAYVVGVTNSKNFPTANPRQTSLRGAGDVFIAKLIESNAPNAVATVSAASYQPTLAPESIAAAFGVNLAPRTEAAATSPLPVTLAGTSIKVRDSAGVERNAPLFFVSAGQINYQIPLGTAAGTATITVNTASGASFSGEARIAPVAPGLFTADATGQGFPAALALRVKADGSLAYEEIARFDPVQNRFVAVPINLGPASESVFLVLYGTGIRGRSALSNVVATIGGAHAETLFASAQGALIGVDQVNLRLPRELAGRGNVDVALTVDSRIANTVRININ